MADAIETHSRALALLQTTTIATLDDMLSPEDIAAPALRPGVAVGEHQGGLRCRLDHLRPLCPSSSAMPARCAPGPSATCPRHPPPTSRD